MDGNRSPCVYLPYELRTLHIVVLSQARLRPVLQNFLLPRGRRGEESETCKAPEYSVIAPATNIKLG